jgi:amino acid adenylation domain-containing protein
MSPTTTAMNDLVSIVAGLPPEKRKILEEILRQRINAGRRAVTQNHLSTAPPLSFTQEGFWALHEINRDSAAYNSGKLLRIDGGLDVTSLKTALSKIVGRHDALRTRFELRDSGPVQIIERSIDIDIPVIDLATTDPAAFEDAAQKAAADDLSRPFDLGQAPQFRVKVFRMSDTSHALLLVAHHIIMDGQSEAVFWRELWECYSAAIERRRPRLKELPFQYADYSVWQKQSLSGDEVSRHLQFWKEALQDAPLDLSLPYDRPRPPSQSFQGRRMEIRFDVGTLRDITSFAVQERVTPFAALLASLQAILYRYSHQQDFIIGFPVAGRKRADSNGVIGPFLNMLPCRARLDDAQTFRELVRSVRDHLSQILEHDALPFRKLVEELGLERGASRHPLFQVMLAFQQRSLHAGLPSHLTVSSIEIPKCRARFDLLFSAVAEQDCLSGFIEYSTDVFQEGTILRLRDHWKRLLAEALRYPDKPISSLQILSGEERAQLLSWNETPENLPCIPVHSMFERQAAQTPNAMAVLTRREQISYGELDRRANQLANYLRARGIGPESVVGLLVRRSVDMVVGLLGIMKAGAAYMPLDPSYPPDRLKYMAQDSHAPLLVLHAEFKDRITEYSGELAQLDTDWNEVSAYSSAPPAVVSHPDNLAYVIYTSGSTGQPKGVMITHRTLGNFLGSMRNLLDVNASHTFVASTSLSFDIAALELFVPLISGAKTLVLEASIAEEGDFYYQSGPSELIIQGTPSVWRLALSGIEAPSNIGTILCGGEPFPSELARALLGRCATLYNMYGPTETTIWSSALPIRKVSAESAIVPIGCPIANTQLYVLDSMLDMAPIGVIGELYIGGDGLARGYSNRPDLTAEKFVPDPYSHIAGQRLYRTGDLARYLADGSIEFVGRADHQVKMRGFRIELGEIQSALEQHTSVRQAVVDIRKGPSGDAQLVAYVVARQAPPAPGDLRGDLAHRLPDYMIPTAFVFMNSLPLTANGKLDRKALPDPEWSMGADAPHYEPPRTEAERLLAEVWRQVLGIERVSIYDNFFELGGDSILGIQAVARASQAGVRLTPRQIFERQTIAQLAEVAQLVA